MKILFVSSGNKKYEDSPIVRNQAESLRVSGIDVDHFYITGKGLSGYVRNIFKLRKYLKRNRYDLIHAHYSLSGIVAFLSSRLPIVTSLMGSDVHSKGIMKILIIFFTRFWQIVIVKSEGMKLLKCLHDTHVIPNGIDLNFFKPMSKKEALKKVGFNNNKRNIIFIGNPNRREKNFQLASDAFELLEDSNLELNVVSGVQFKDIPYYYYAADLLLLTSLWEGSPNVIKEAMACNCQIVTTDVGDVRWIIGDTKGCFITSFNPKDVAGKIKSALDFAEKKGSPTGRNRIKELNLDSESIAKKLIDIYESVLKQKRI